MKASILIVANHHLGVCRFLSENFFCAKIKVKVGLGSTSATWDRVSPILGVPPIVSNFESIRTSFSRFCLHSTDICKAGVAILASFILLITIRIYGGF